VTQALERTGSTVTSAGLVLAGTFGVFAVVESGQPGGAIYRDILASLAIGILMDAFGVRTLLVPSTVALLGRWNWWPSAHGRRPAYPAAEVTAASTAFPPKARNH
jgi:RND superfamily putative drug exporter